MTRVWNHAFGTYVVSAPFELPSLPRIAEVRADALFIRLEWADAGMPGSIEWQHHWTDRGEILLSLGQQEAGYIVRVPNCADFLLDISSRGVRIAATAAALDAATLEHLLVDQVLPRLLSQLGATLMHAGAVRIGGRWVLFLGDSGWGKSTLSGLLHRAGHPVLSDDCLQLFDDADGHVRVIPTYPSLRLKQDSLRFIFPDGENAMPFAGGSGKRRVPLTALSAPQLPAIVDALYLLGDPKLADDDIQIVQASPVTTCLALIRHSFRLDLADHDGNALQLQRCAAIARAIPGFQLRYPHAQHRNAVLLHTLLDHVVTLPAAAELGTATAL